MQESVGDASWLSILDSIQQSGDARRQKTLHGESGARPLIGYPRPK